jgi:hypothetical protein
VVPRPGLPSLGPILAPARTEVTSDQLVFIVKFNHDWCDKIFRRRILGSSQVINETDILKQVSLCVVEEDVGSRLAFINQTFDSFSICFSLSFLLC